MENELRVITLWRPWDQAILHGGKDIENRVWPLWEKLIGKTMALHAGKKYDQEGADWMIENGLYIPPSKEESPTGIVGTFKVVDVTQQSDSPWFFGPWGWVVEEAVALPEPIPCPGKQGVWTVPDELVKRVVGQ